MDDMLTKVIESTTSLNRGDFYDERDAGFIGKMDKSGNIEIVPLTHITETLSYQEFVAKAIKY